MGKKIFGPIILVLGVLVTLTPRFILPICEYYGKPVMNCSYMGKIEIILGILLMAVAFAIFLARSVEAQKWLMYVAFLIGLSVMVVPSVIGYCPSSQMPCNYGTVPMERFLGMILLVSSIVGFVLAAKAETPAK